VRQIQPHPAVLALPLVVVGAAVVLPQLALLIGRQLGIGLDLRRVVDLFLWNGTRTSFSPVT
jgi:hypothetical protein